MSESAAYGNVGEVARGEKPLDINSSIQEREESCCFIFFKY